MKWSKWLENWDMTSLKINLKFLEMEWEPKEPDKDAAWELYIEMLTRVVTQFVPANHGDEETALESVHDLFSLTRDIIKRYKRDCIDFTKISIVVLNQVVRPFTTKWHKEHLAGAFENEDKRLAFRQELKDLQVVLRNYAGMLCHMAGVEDLSTLEQDISS